MKGILSVLLNDEWRAAVHWRRYTVQLRRDAITCALQELHVIIDHSLQMHPNGGLAILNWFFRQEQDIRTEQQEVCKYGVVRRTNLKLGIRHLYILQVD